jgi:aminobenzoyl-glutamate utilization protein B
MVHVAKAMAGCAIDVLQDKGLLAAAKAEHQARLAVTPYESPLPEGIAPPFRMAE